MRPTSSTSPSSPNPSGLWFRRLIGSAGLLISLLGAMSCQLLPEQATPGATMMPTTRPTVTPTATASPTATCPPTNTPTMTSTPTRTRLPLWVEVGVSRRSIVQGHTIEIRLLTSHRCQVHGSIDSRPLRFYSEDGYEHFGLAGVHALAPQERQELVIAIRSDDGQELVLKTGIDVAAGDYAQEVLDFSPSVAKLLDPAIANPEMERIAGIYARYTPVKHWQGRFDWPMIGRITSAYGTRRDYGGRLRSYHTGVDIVDDDSDAVRTPARGVVVLAERLQVRGNAIIVDHGMGVLSGYYHLSQIDVTKGQQVTRGEQLGLMGSTGLVTGKHLHWELRVGGIAVDPVEWTESAFCEPGDKVEGEDTYGR